MDEDPRVSTAPQTILDLVRDEKVIRAAISGVAPAHLLDDCISEGHIALMEARAKGVSPKIVVRRRVIDFLRMYTKTNKTTGERPKMIAFCDAMPQSVENPDPEPRKSGRVTRNRAIRRVPNRREMQCLVLLSEGLQVKQIAERLALSRLTIETYFSRLRGLAGAHSQIQLVNAAVDRGWIEPRGRARVRIDQPDGAKTDLGEGPSGSHV